MRWAQREDEERKDGSRTSKERRKSANSKVKRK